jgi:hypothetical protein
VSLIPVGDDLLKSFKKSQCSAESCEFFQYTTPGIFARKICTLNCVIFFRYRATNLGAW